MEVVRDSRSLTTTMYEGACCIAADRFSAIITIDLSELGDLWSLFRGV